MDSRGWDQCDFALVTGDAYVDHPSFGSAIISRVLENAGYKIGIISQPNWNNIESFKVLGRPKLGFLITSGNMDSMVNHYTASNKPRRNDAYSPGGKAGNRPDRASIVYSNCVRQAYKKMPVIIGGVEASLRRLAHYDYWSNKLRRSILLDSKADLLIYGMAEKAIVKTANLLRDGIKISEITTLRGTVYKSSIENLPDNALHLPSHEKLKNNKLNFAESVKIQYENTDPFLAKPLVEKYGTQVVVQNPPEYPLTSQELDKIYELPYVRKPYSGYKEKIPAIEEIEFSILSSRGCYGTCNFCALAFHQGRIIQGRTHKSMINEAKEMVEIPNFKGYIHDVGGPTANFRKPACKKQLTKGSCKTKRCLFPKPCDNLEVDHTDYLKLLRSLRNIQGIKKVFIRSGIRFDYLIEDKNSNFIEELCKYHVSGQLKVAPEHVSSKVLSFMSKPSIKVYEKFKEVFIRTNKKLGMKQYLVPYFISSHPGSNLKSAIELAEYFKKTGFIPNQVQDFYPTPGTISTCMYYTEVDPFSKKPVYVPKNFNDKAMQRALLHFNRKENYKMVKKALIQANRGDLIGFKKHCLIAPERRR